LKMIAAVVHLPNPFDPTTREVAEITGHGVTIQGYLEVTGKTTFDMPTVCVYNGQPLLRKDWATTEIKDHDTVHFVAVPQGGGGGNTGKMILSAILMVVVIIAAVYLAPALAGSLAELSGVAALGTASAAQAIGAVIVLGATLLINTFLLAPEIPGQPRSVSESPLYEFGARANQAKPNAAIQVTYGKHLVIPDHIAQQWTEYEGQHLAKAEFIPPPGSNDARQIQYSLMCLGHGKYQVHEFKIGSLLVAKDDGDSYRPEVAYYIYEPNENINTTGGTHNPARFPGGRAVNTSLGSVELLGPEDSVGAIPNQTRGQLYPTDINKSLIITNIDKTTDPNNHRITVALKAGGTLPAWTTDKWANAQVWIGYKGLVTAHMKDFQTPPVAYPNFDGGSQGAQNFKQYEFAQYSDSDGKYISHDASKQTHDSFDKFWGHDPDAGSLSASAPAMEVAHHELLVHPVRLQTITNSSATNGTSDTTCILTINGTFYDGSADAAVYGLPSTAPYTSYDVPDDTNGNDGVFSECHIRQDYEGPHIINASGTQINKVTFDVGGPPMFHQDEKDRYRVGIGLRPEVQEIDDSGNPVGRWKALPLNNNDESGNGRARSGIFRTVWKQKGWWQWLAGGWDGRVRSRYSTVGLWSPSTDGPVRLSLTYPVPAGRYQARLRRPTFKHDNNPKHVGWYSQIVWMGLRGNLVTNQAQYPGVTTLATRIVASADINRNTANYANVVVTRKLRVYGGAEVALDLTGFLNTANGSKVITVDLDPSDLHLTDADQGLARAHNLETGQTVTISGQSGSVGGIPDTEINGTYVVTVLDRWTFQYTVPTTSATSASANQGSANVQLDAVAEIIEDVATRNPAWAIVDMATNGNANNLLTGAKQYGGGLSDDAIDWTAFREIATIAAIREDWFDAVYDQKTTLWQAMNEAARVVRSRVIFNGSKLSIVRDRAQSTYKGVFGPDNIVKDTLQVNYSFMSLQSPDSVMVEYIDNITWKPTTVHAYYDSNYMENPANIRIRGITDQEHARREGSYIAAVNRYQRVSYTFSTELEGLLVGLGDLILISHPMADWSDSGNFDHYHDDTNVLVADRDLDWDSYTDDLFLEDGTDNAWQGDPTAAVPTGWSAAGTNTEIGRWSDWFKQYDFEDQSTATTFKNDKWARGVCLLVSHDQVGTPKSVFAGTQPVDADGNSTAREGTGVCEIKGYCNPSDDLYVGIATAVTQDTDGVEFEFGSFAQGTIWRARAWVRATTPQTVGVSVKMIIREYSTANGTYDGVTGYSNPNKTCADIILTEEWQLIELERAIFYSDVWKANAYIYMHASSANWEVNCDGELGADGFDLWEVDSFEIGLGGKSRKAHTGDYCAWLYKGAAGANTWGLIQTNLTPADWVSADHSGEEWGVSCWVKGNKVVGDSGKNVRINLRTIPFVNSATSDFVVAAELCPEHTWIYLEKTGAIIDTANTTSIQILAGGNSVDVPDEDSVYWFSEMRIFRAGDTQEHQLCWRNPDGSVQGPYVVTRGATDRHIILPGALAAEDRPLTLYNRQRGVDADATQPRDEYALEPAIFVFGKTTNYDEKAIVTGIAPRGETQVELSAVKYDERVYTADNSLPVMAALSPEPLSPEDAPVIDQLEVTVYGESPHAILRASWTDAPGAAYYEVQLGEDTADLFTGAPLLGVVTRYPFQVSEDADVFEERIDYSDYESSITNVSTNGVNGVLTIVWKGHPFVSGDVVTVAGGAVAIGGITQDQWNLRKHTVTVSTADVFTINTVGTATSTVFAFTNLVLFRQRKTTVGGVLYPMVVTVEEDYTGPFFSDDDDSNMSVRLQDAPWYVDEDTGAFATTWVIIGQTSLAAAIMAGQPESVDGDYNTYSNHWVQNHALIPLLLSQQEEDEVVDDTDNFIPNYHEVALVTPRDGDIPVSVRVRGVGRLRGPWRETVITVKRSERPMSAAVSPASGVMGLAATGSMRTSGVQPTVQQSKTFWVNAEALGVGTHLIDSVELPANHIIDAVEIEIMEAFNSSSVTGEAILIGDADTPDQDYYIAAGYWNGTDGYLSTTGYRLSENPRDNGFTGQGAGWGTFQAAAMTVGVYRVELATSTTGKARVTIKFRVVDPDPAV